MSVNKKIKQNKIGHKKKSIRQTRSSRKSEPIDMESAFRKQQQQIRVIESVIELL